MNATTQADLLRRIRAELDASGAVSTTLVKKYRATLTDEQKQWISDKSQWEHMSGLAVIREWDVPEPAELVR